MSRIVLVLVLALAAVCLLGAPQAGLAETNSALPFGVTIGGQAVDGSNTDLSYGVLKTAVAADALLVIDKQAEQTMLIISLVGEDDWPKDEPVATITFTGNSVKLNATASGQPIPPGDYHMAIAAGDASALVRFTIGPPGTPSKWAAGTAAAPAAAPAATPAAPATEAAAAPAAKQSDDEAQTMIYYAMQNDEFEEFKRLLAANPGAAKLKQSELLRGACGFANNPAVVKLLLEAGADPNAKDENNAQSCLHTLIEQSREDTAILNNVSEICALLVARGADVNYQRPSDGLSPLQLAAHLDYVGRNIMAALLAAKNADVNSRTAGDNAGNNKGWTPLFLVCDRGFAATGENKEVAELLIARGADVNAVFPDGVADPTHALYTPLHMAAGRNTDRVDVAALLIEKGAAVNALDKGKNPPLAPAMLTNNVKITQFLLEHGADYNVKNWEGVSVLEGAYGYGRDMHLEAAEAVIRWAESHGEGRR